MRSILILLTVAASLAAQSSLESRQLRLRWSLGAEARPGGELPMLLRFELEPGWHLYWRNPGEAGLEPRFRWTLPEGFAVGPVLWPVPERIRSSGLWNFGYETELALLVPLSVPEDWDGRPVTLACKVSWLVCKEACLSGSGTLSLELGGAPTDEEPIAAARARLPRTAEDASARVDGAVFELRIPDVGELPASTYFFPEQPDWIEPAAEPECRLDDDGALVLRVPCAAGEVPARVRGILAVGEHSSRQGLAIDLVPALE